MKTKRIYHVGETLTQKSKISRGELLVDKKHLVLDRQPHVKLPLDSIRSVSWQQLKGLGKFVRIEIADQTVYFAAVSFAFWFMASIQRARTKALYDLLQPRIPASSAETAAAAS